ncbi:4'-phosphopantetheinyl transferase superfamily protein [Pelistega sp. NLN82]|uniref:4'-phosphopantetheinyl transferase superfamily protein n=1 Tax=Pelistega ratti TaxID=2652177 RepID=A0A6L9Y4J3_9BURK|nr:4'-phosphopantetheinyl transferase superfamily protein [Pelistega ratti]NEN75311.1 4'-phosphopantetheinyl transferase superfamily protein [Pelistega ratti]
MNNLFNLNLKYFTLERVNIFYYSFQNREILKRHCKEYFISCLSAQDLDKAYTYKLPVLIQRTIASKALTRLILSNYLNNKRPVDITIQVGQYGKPFIPNSTIYFSISHCETAFLMGVSKDDELGVDIENLKGYSYHHLVDMVLSVEEKKYYQSMPIELQEQTFLSFWTKKEALLKANGTGIKDNLNQLDTIKLFNKQYRPQYWCREIVIDKDHQAHVVGKYINRGD